MYLGSSLWVQFLCTTQHFMLTALLEGGSFAFLGAPLERRPLLLPQQLLLPPLSPSEMGKQAACPGPVQHHSPVLPASMFPQLPTPSCITIDLCGGSEMENEGFSGSGDLMSAAAAGWYLQAPGVAGENPVQLARSSFSD